MCFVHEFDLVFPDGSRWPQYNVTPCPAGTTTSPCPEYRRVVGRPQPAPATAVRPHYVEARPASSGSGMARGSTSPPPSGGLRNRRGANDMRLEFELHVPGTRRSGDGGSRSGSGRSSISSTQQSRGAAIFSPPPPPPAHPQYATYRPERLRAYHEVSQWTPPPHVVTVDPSRHTPPTTPAPRRSRSAGPTAGREHARGHSRPRSRASRRTVSPHAPSPRRSTASLESERAQQIRDLSDQIDRLVAEQDRARRLRDNDIRIAALSAQIKELRRQRHPTRPIELHQRGETSVRNPARRSLHRAGDSLDTLGRRALQRDIDEGVRAGQRGGGGGAAGGATGAAAGGATESRPRPRRLTTGDGGGTGFEGLFRRPSRRREHIVLEGEPRHGQQRHR